MVNIWRCSLYGNYAGIQQCIADGADVNDVNLIHPAWISVAARRDDYTPLQLTAYRGHQRCAELLIENGADVNKARKLGQTPLYIVAEIGQFEFVRMLILKGSNINSLTENGATPLYIASENGHVDTVHALLEKEPLLTWRRTMVRHRYTLHRTKDMSTLFASSSRPVQT